MSQATVENTAVEKITVEVAYALPDKQKIIRLQVPIGTTAKQAVSLSGIADSFPDADMEHAAMGIFSQVLGSKELPGPDEYQLQPRDRVEIYRVLQVDPKEVRKQRAAKARQARTQQSESPPAK